METLAEVRRACQRDSRLGQLWRNLSVAASDLIIAKLQEPDQVEEKENAFAHAKAALSDKLAIKADDTLLNEWEIVRMETA